MTKYNEYNPFPEKGDILYGRPIDYKRIQKRTNTGEHEVLSLAEPHYMLVIQAFPKSGFVITVSSTSMKRHIHYPDLYTLNNVLIVDSDYRNNGLDAKTIFEFHPRTINLLRYTNEFFEPKDSMQRSPLMGKLNENYRSKLTDLHAKCPEVQNIGSYLVNNRKQILEKDLHEDNLYRLPLVTVIYKKK